jgi:hypothetical protein
MSKPITIQGCPGGYNVFVGDAPIVHSGGGVDFDRVAAGLKVKKGYKAPTSTLPVIFQQAGDAAHVAHKIGRYVLKMGDLVFSYTRLVNVGPAEYHDEWWEKALKE